jgi:hypothetical protein
MRIERLRADQKSEMSEKPSKAMKLKRDSKYNSSRRVALRVLSVVQTVVKTCQSYQSHIYFQKSNGFEPMPPGMADKVVPRRRAGREAGALLEGGGVGGDPVKAQKCDETGEARSCQSVS